MRAKILCVGNIGSGKTTLCKLLSRILAWEWLSIDDCRREHADGTASGEARAWAVFLEAAQGPQPAILECTGGGAFVDLLRYAVDASGLATIVVMVRTSSAACLERVRSRGLDVPYPDFQVPIEAVIPAVEMDIERHLSMTWAYPRIDVDGTSPSEAGARSAVSFLEAQFR